MLLAVPLVLYVLTLLARRPRYVTRTVGVCNDDWASKGSNLADLIAAGCQLIFIQEGKRAHYRELRDADDHRLLPYDTWGVIQDVSSPARAGSVIIWHHAAYSARKRGWTFGAKAPGIMARWMAWTRGHIGRARVFLFCAHWPPVRVRRFQPVFTAAVRTRLWLAHQAGRVILGGVDSNQHGGPPLPPWLHWHTAVPGSIDGLICSADVIIDEARELPKDTSDHHPQVFVVRVPV
jgi:hypothetical protein